ncbi:putative ribonuclease H-like domain-containing protein [Tanacetum coccineum]
MISQISNSILKKEEYDIWAMEMEHYLEYIDNDVWKKFKLLKKKGRLIIIVLMGAIPKEHIENFHGMDGFKVFWEAIKTNRVGKGFDRFHYYIPVEALVLKFTEDANHKFSQIFAPCMKSKVPQKHFQVLKGLLLLQSKSSTNKVSLVLLEPYSTSTPPFYFFNQIFQKKVALAGFADKAGKQEKNQMGLLTLDDEEDSVGKPLYIRFIKTNGFKGVSHPLSGDYTPKPQEEIDESLYVYGKKGPQNPEPIVSDDGSSEYSTYQSNNSAESIGTSSEHSVDLEYEIFRVPQEDIGDYYEKKMARGPALKNKCFYTAMEGNWGSAVKTSAGYNWRPTRPNSNCNGGPTFIRTDHPLKNMVDRGIFDSGCSGHMTGNKDQLEDFEEFNGGSVTFGRVQSYTYLDETSGILQNFIRQIENQLNHRVKIIRSDNGTEFKNRDMLEFCGNKGIKQEYSNARTPQQNGVAKRMNKTLIEAAKTMLADSLLPTTLWAEAVSTACYCF